MPLTGSAFVYLLRCADGTFYCGWTTDLERRVAAHADGKGARYTRGRGPLELAAAWRADDRTTAMRLEILVKRMPRRAKERLVVDGGLPGAERVVAPPGPDAVP